MHLLLVEDDLNLGNALRKLLGGHFTVAWVRDLAAARARWDAGQYDLLLLDLGLPDGDGVAWLRELRDAGCQAPVMILSARDGLDDRVAGLDTGADDYLVKPFEAEELLARIRVLLRRQAGTAAPRIVAGDLSYAPDAQQFYVGDEPLRLSPQERQLLAVLIAAAGRPVSRERLTQQLYGLAEGGDSNTLEVRIHALRRLLGRERIETVRGLGYRLVVP